MNIFKLPDLGEGLPDAEVVRWLVKEGDVVKVDQPMVEMETAKAVVEVPSPYSGTITKLHGQAGDVILVGAVLVEFDGEVGASSVSTTTKSEAVTQPKPTNATAPSNKKASGGAVFKLPDLGEGLPDAEVVRWLVSEGESVTLDQPMVEMETAKAVVEVPSPQTGIIGTIHGQAGDVILVGAPLVTFVGENDTNEVPQESDASEEKSADAGTVVGAVEVGNTVVAESASAVIKALARKLKVDLTQVTGTGTNGIITQADIKAAAKSGTKTVSSQSTQTPAAGTDTSNPLAYKASPAVRALARRLGVDLSQCRPTGRKGSITRDDVEAVSQNSASVASPVAASSSNHATSSTTTTSSSGNRLPTINITREPQQIRGVRRAMAQGMAHSHATVVPTTLVEDVNISQWKKGTDSLARYMRALVSAARVEPALNAWFDGENMERLLHPEVNIGIAVDTPDGLYVPVVHCADQMDMNQTRAKVQELRDKIASKAIKPDNLANGTITLSNFGSIAGRYGTPVVSPPQVAILGTGRFRNELKLTDKGIENQKMLPLSLTFDHRACTGGEAARFLAAIMEDLAKAE